MGDASGDGIQFHTIQAAVGHAVGQHTEKITHAHGRLQNIAGLEAHPLYGIIDGANHYRRGIVSVQRGSAGGGILFFGEQSFQLGVLGRPIFFVRVKSIR